MQNDDVIVHYVYFSTALPTSIELSVYNLDKTMNYVKKYDTSA